MNKIRVIDLLNKIANGEIKDKQKFRVIYQYSDLYRDIYYDENEGSFLNSLKNISDDYVIYDEVSLNDEIEIIEEPKKIENIDLYYGVYENIKDKWVKKNIADINSHLCILENKLNEIIDYINKGDNNE